MGLSHIPIPHPPRGVGGGGSWNAQKRRSSPLFLIPLLRSRPGGQGGAGYAQRGRSQKPGYFFLLLEIIIKKIRSQFPLIFLPSPDPDPGACLPLSPYFF